MSQTSWYLEGYIGSEDILSRIPLAKFPFQVGRQEGLGFTVPSNTASRFHAEILCGGSSPILIDCASTNGTFINRERVAAEQPVNLRHGDVLHFGDFEVRIIELEQDDEIDLGSGAHTVVGLPELSENLPTGYHELKEMIDERKALACFQPIIDVLSGSIHAYEILGRGKHPKLSESPGPLFLVAESFDLAMELSEIFRDVGVSKAAEFDVDTTYFLNIHPDEHYDNSRLLRQLETIRSAYPNLSLVMEVHEESAPDIGELKDLIKNIRSFGIKVAYDDFGSGQARLLELVEVPADYLKFDIAMVRGIDRAPPAKRDMVAALVTQARNVGTKTLAEGLERIEEVEACVELGFDFIQGFYFGKPEPELISQIDVPFNPSGPHRLQNLQQV